MVAEVAERGSQGQAQGERHIVSLIPRVDWPVVHEKEEEEQQLPLNLRSRTGRGGEKVEEQAGSDLGKYEDLLPTPQKKAQVEISFGCLLLTSLTWKDSRISKSKFIS